MHPVRQVRLVVLALAAVVTPALHAQTSELYITTATGVSVVRNGAVQRQWSQSDNRALAIAVDGAQVRTNGAVGAPSGFEYRLDGTATGTAFPFLGPWVDAAYDGTTDGTHNYLLSVGSQWIWRTDRDWRNPVALFRAGPTPSANAGLTYDPTSNTLWVGGWGAGGLQQFSLTGQRLGGFATVARNVSALAFDRADNTFWMSDFSGSPTTLFQYSLGGALLNTVQFDVSAAGAAPGALFGGEFGPAAEITATPEPGSVALLAAGLGALGVAVRRRRRA